MSKKSRRYLSPEKKAELIRQHLSDKKPVSEICEENDLQPSVFYTWMRQLLANAPAALVNGNTRKQGIRREEELSRRSRRVTGSRIMLEPNLHSPVTIGGCCFPNDPLQLDDRYRGGPVLGLFSTLGATRTEF